VPPAGVCRQRPVPQRPRRGQGRTRSARCCTRTSRVSSRSQRSGAHQVPADALANIQALGGVLAWSTQEDGVGKSELYVQVPSQG
jgi:hypothetical protein